MALNYSGQTDNSSSDILNKISHTNTEHGAVRFDSCWPKYTLYVNRLLKIHYFHFCFAMFSGKRMACDVWTGAVATCKNSISIECCCFSSLTTTTYWKAPQCPGIKYYDVTAVCIRQSIRTTVAVTTYTLTSLSSPTSPWAVLRHRHPRASEDGPIIRSKQWALHCLWRSWSTLMYCSKLWRLGLANWGW